MSERASKRPPSTRRGIPHKRPRKRLSCEPCRSAKLRCDRQQPCASCRRRECGAACTFRASRGPVVADVQLGVQSRVINTRDTILEEVPGENILEQASSVPAYLSQTAAPSTATPSAAPSVTTGPDYHYASTTPTTPRRAERRHENKQQGQQQDQQQNQQHPASTAPLDGMLERPAPGQSESAPGPANALLAPFSFGRTVPMSELLSMLPSSTLCEYLISRYFIYQAPMFHVLHGPTFQKQYTEFTRGSAPPSLSWLALLFVVCSSAVLTLDVGDPILNDYQSTNTNIRASDPMLLSRQLRSTALTCLSEAQFMVRYDFNTLEALLVMIYGICHSEGADRGWVFLGAALNMGMALRCNVDSPDLDQVKKERRWRCWAGIRMLHTYQGLLFNDVDMSFLLNISGPIPADMNDWDAHVDRRQETWGRPSNMSLMRFKLRLFELSTRVCSRVSNPAFDEPTMNHYDSLIASEQKQWDAVFLVDGSPSLLDTESPAHWCILQTYAHQLYLLIHRPFYHSQSSRFLSFSRERYLQSSKALLDVHRQICELPTLRPYRWLVNGLTSFNALQSAVALAACIMDRPGRVDTSSSDRMVFDDAVRRIEELQKSSPICARAFPALQNLRNQLAMSSDDVGAGSTQALDVNTDWLDLNFIDWVRLPIPFSLSQDAWGTWVR